MFFFILNHKISFLCYVASSQLFENHSQYIDIRIFLLPIIGVCHKNRLGSNKVFFCFKKKKGLYPRICLGDTTEVFNFRTAIIPNIAINANPMLMLNASRRPLAVLLTMISCLKQLNAATFQMLRLNSVTSIFHEAELRLQQADITHFSPGVKRVKKTNEIANRRIWASWKHLCHLWLLLQPLSKDQSDVCGVLSHLLYLGP